MQHALQELGTVVSNGISAGMTMVIVMQGMAAGPHNQNTAAGCCNCSSPNGRAKGSCKNARLCTLPNKSPDVDHHTSDSWLPGVAG